MIGNLRAGIQSSGLMFILFTLLAILQSLTLASVARFGDHRRQVGPPEAKFFSPVYLAKTVLPRRRERLSGN